MSPPSFKRAYVVCFVPKINSGVYNICTHKETPPPGVTTVQRSDWIRWRCVILVWKCLVNMIMMRHTVLSQSGEMFAFVGLMKVTIVKGSAERIVVFVTPSSPLTDGWHFLWSLFIVELDEKEALNRQWCRSFVAIILSSAFFYFLHISTFSIFAPQLKRNNFLSGRVWSNTYRELATCVTLCSARWGETCDDL